MQHEPAPILSYLPLLTESVTKTSNQLQTSLKSGLNQTITKLSQIKTNIVYNIKHSNLPLVQRKEVKIIDDGSKAVLLGQEYDHQSYCNFLFVFRNILWFTYRKGIKQIESDNGWGCMIRTVQMVLAETLKRSLNIKGHLQKEQHQIIRHFSEQSDGALSLSAICKEGNIDKRWTSSIEVLSTFQKIIKKDPRHFSFGIEIVSSGVVYDTAKSQLLDSYPSLVCLSNRVSLSDIPKQLHGHYLALMGHPSWVGAIGGTKGQALYIVGHYDNKAIFLDPHLVQDNEEQMQIWSYSCQTPRSIDLAHLSPSLSFCYYIRNCQQHLEWLEWVESLNEAHHPNLIFELISKATKEQMAKQMQQVESQMVKKEVDSRKDSLSGEIQVLEDPPSGSEFAFVQSSNTLPSKKDKMSSVKSLQAADQVVETTNKNFISEDSDNSSQFEVLV